MLKVIKRSVKKFTKDERIELLESIFENCIRYVGKQIVLNIYNRDDTNTTEDIESVFNLLLSINMSVLLGSPIFGSLIDNTKINVEDKRKIAEITYSEFIRNFRTAFEETILCEIKDITTH